MKKIFILILTFIFALTFASCMNANGTSESADDTPSVNSITDPSDNQSKTNTPDESSVEESSVKFTEESTMESTEELSKEESSAEEPSAEESSEESRLSKLELIASLKVGEDILYSDRMCGFISGPQSYCVNEKGDIYIVSGQESKIMCVNDKKTLKLDVNFQPTDCNIIGDTIYVLTYFTGIYSNGIRLYDIEKGLIDKYDLPDNLNSNDVRNIKFNTNGFYIETRDDNIYVFDKKNFQKTKNNEYRYAENKTTYLFNPDEKFIFTANGMEVTINLGGDKVAGYLGYDETGFYLYIVEYLPHSFKQESSVCKYDFNGNLIDYAILDFTDCVAYPLNPVLFVNGKLYLMRCTEETVNVYILTLGNADVSHLYES